MQLTDSAHGMYSFKDPLQQCHGLEAGAPEVGVLMSTGAASRDSPRLLSPLVVERSQARGTEYNAVVSEELLLSGSLSVTVLQCSCIVCSLLMDKPHLQYRP